MNKMVLITGALGVLFLFIAIFLIGYVVFKIFKRKTKVKTCLMYTFISVFLFAFSFGFINFSFFLQTFSRYVGEERIGKVYAEIEGSRMKIYFYDEKHNKTYNFYLTGDQWMVEGCILRWSAILRWLGLDSYYRITRFRGRWITPNGEKPVTFFIIVPEGKMWRFLLRYGKYIPFVDAVYGIGAFQYPSQDTCYIYINDSGFILRFR